jgi:hypothetical protein
MNKNLSSKNFAIVLFVASAVSFIIASLLSAGYLALYHFLRDHFDLGFWQVVFLYAIVVTGLSTITVVNRSKL